MINIITKYWIEFLLGLIVLFLGFIFKLFKQEGRRWIQKEVRDTLQETISQLTQENKEQNEKIQKIYEGIINLQGVSFKSYCRTLLHDDHNFTLEEFENCQREYEIYTSLGGNGQGTILYNLVCEKAKSIANKEIGSH